MSLTIHKFDPALHDSLIPELTNILHRAYAPLAQQGLRYFASHQLPEVTRSRLTEGEAYLFFEAGRLIGCVSLAEGIHKAVKCEYYSRPGVFFFSQFAVEPDCQGKGYGTKVMGFLEERARELGAAELALDTSEKAHDLIRRYTNLGYEKVSETQWPDVNYRSLIFAKRLS